MRISILITYSVRCSKKSSTMYKNNKETHSPVHTHLQIDARARTHTHTHTHTHNLAHSHFCMHLVFYSRTLTQNLMYSRCPYSVSFCQRHSTAHTHTCQPCIHLQSHSTNNTCLQHARYNSPVAMLHCNPYYTYTRSE